MAVPLRPYPSPIELNGSWNFFKKLEKKSFKKKSFFLSGKPFTSYGPAIKEKITTFCGFPRRGGGLFFCRFLKYVYNMKRKGKAEAV